VRLSVARGVMLLGIVAPLLRRCCAVVAPAVPGRCRRPRTARDLPKRRGCCHSRNRPQNPEPKLQTTSPKPYPTPPNPYPTHRL